MSNDCPKRDCRSLEEVTISNIWEIATIVAVRKHDERRRFNDLVCGPRRV